MAIFKKVLDRHYFLAPLELSKFYFNTFRAAWFRNFHKKKQQFSVALPTL